MDDQQIIFKITGEGITPASIDTKELADLLDAFQSVVLEKTRMDNPTADLSNLFISLTEVKTGSAFYGFSTSIPSLVLPSYKYFQKSIKSKNTKNLPNKSIESLKRIHAYTKKRNCTTDFALSVDNSVHHAIITKESTFTFEKGIKGETFIYGTIIRVGGKDPTVTIEYENGFQITCNVSKEIAKQLASRLYDYVGLRGIAKWVGHDLSLDSFKVLELMQFEESSVSNSFKELSKVIGKYYSDIEDPNEYINIIRRGEEKSRE